MSGRSFADVEAFESRRRRAKADHFATVEVGHAESRTGIIVRVEHLGSNLEPFMACVFDRAGSIDEHLRRVTDPGWWVAVVCAQALAVGRPACVLRVPERSKLHGAIVVERGSLADVSPTWPLVRLQSPLRRMLDLRPESVLELGPCDDDLKRYAVDAHIDADVSSLRSMFDLGVLEWAAATDPRTGRRCLRAAGDIT